MRHLDSTLATPERNLACDEALLDLCEHGEADEILRFWEPGDYFAVLGYANRTLQEVNLETCRARGVSILRRCSGGGAILQGPGCLNYSLVLALPVASPLHSISATNRFIMERHRRALEEALGAPVQIQGHTDLTLGHWKFSGNAQRRKRHAVLFHGTFLLHFDLAMIEPLLRHPARQPEYRRDRRHVDFLANLGIPPSRIKEVLRRTWQADQPFTGDLEPRINQLTQEKYSQPEWNFKF